LVKTHAYDLGITTKRAQDPLRIPDAMIDVYLHLPAGSQNKDGPSAGVAMVRSPLFLSGFGAKLMVVGLVQVCAIVSLLTGKCVPPTTTMTDEVRLFPLLPL
jgi:ATP-dependent Lon protease